MKKLKVLVEALNAKALNAPPEWEEREINRIFVSDLISDILIAEGENILLITSLLSDQVLRTANVIGASAVVLVNRRHVPVMLGKAAAKQGIALFHTPLPKFESCVRLGHLMESA
ncbi:MAG TPA: hypothetical protein PLD51_03590 [Pontiellaceae bacterium]|nr:hypothetical protein [Pontiellaceae bacterium]